MSFVRFDITVCGIEELSGYCEAGVSHVLSILDPDYPEPPAVRAFTAGARLELRFHDVIDDREGVVAPQAAHVARLLAFGRGLLEEASPGAHLLVHCHAGVSRSTAATAVLLAQARPDRPAAEALAEVVRIRPYAWPNLRVLELGDALLGLGGELVAAARAHYEARLAGDPFLARALVESGRGREVPGDIGVRRGAT